MNRRVFLAAGTAALAGCDAVYSSLAGRLSGGVPMTFARPEGQAVDPDVFLLRRATFGPAPGDLDRLRAVGRNAWLDEQLHPERIDDTACGILVRRFESLRMTPGDLFEFKREVAEDEIARATLLRAVYSRRQVYEALVEFWSDHFNVFQGKGDCAWLKTADDRDVVRRHALGRFRDLLRASALSPAMLVYLDGRENHKAKPNENYARELLELHTLGVHGGYTQADVMEVARCLTGWDVKRGWFKGQVRFHPERHDDGPKRVLGVDLPAGGGEKDLDRVLDIVCAHPSTARYVAGKLCRRFVADDPPRAVVDRVAARFTATGGDLRETAREVLKAVEPGPVRFKRPFRFVVSALRGLAATTQGKRPVRRFLERMGQAPFQYPTPDGYPDEPEPWMGTLLWRWTFALELAQGRVDDVKIGLPLGSREDLFAHLVGRRPSETEKAA
ncbi:MAG TPA: DUF1800 domain-containing protein, partial [Planctomycetota bacterium]|nr:DUF1800 domain-containing protein [Planctomycetota bacterium]